MAVARTVWKLTPDAFDSLLSSLHPDREQAGRVYENLRRKLLEFFEARGSFIPDEHADETLDRVMRRLSEGEPVQDPSSYCYGVAKFVWKEALRARSREPIELNDNLHHSSANSHAEIHQGRLSLEQRLDCMEVCLSSLADTTRSFIIEYFKEDDGTKITHRKHMAEEMNTSLNALRLRASRLKREVARCTEECTRNKGIR